MTFVKLCKSGLYMLKFHSLDHVVEGLASFTSMEMLDWAQLARLNGHTKIACRWKLQLQVSRNITG